MSREPFLPPHRGLSPLATEHEPNVRDYWGSSRPYWRRAAIGVLAGTALAAIIAFVWPPTFIARATLLPPTEEDTGFSAASILRGLNMPGIKIPSRSGPEDVTVSILRSRRL